MSDDRFSRRTVLGASATALTMGAGGCQSVLPSSENDDSEGAEESDSTATRSTPTESRTSTQLYADDFESGTLEGYDIVEYPGDDDTQTFQITTDPSRDEYAVQHQTESRYLTPTGDSALEPPLTFSLEFYVDGWSGIDIALQHDESQNLTYLIKVRDNNSGPFIEVEKKLDNYTEAESRKLMNDRNENSVFMPRQWETVTVDWRTDGTITAGIESSGESVNITDTELAGHPFRINGYHYDGSATFDNLAIRR